MQELIQIGDEIKNYIGESVEVTGIESGKYGLLVKGKFSRGGSYEAYVPYELPPCEEIEPWYGWSHRTFLTLPSGYKLGDVTFWGDDPRDTLEEYDAEWERTIEQIRMEGTQVNEKGS